MNTTFDRLQNLIANRRSIEPATITPQSTFESLGLDSLDLIELLFDVEDEFKIRIPQDGGSALRTVTVQDIVNSIDGILNAAPAQAAGGVA